MRFTGKVSYIERNGSLFARGVYRDENNKPQQVWRKVVSSKGTAKQAVIEEIERRLNKTEKKEKTFKDLAAYYREHHAVAPEFVDDVKVRGKKSYKIMLLDIGLLEAFFGDKPLKEITRDDIHRYKLFALDKPVRRMQDGKPVYKKRALATVHHHLRTLRSMFGVAYDEHWIDRIPSFRELISAASEPRRESIPDDEEFHRLLDAANVRDRLKHVRPIMLMIADTGARPIELWNLLWKDVDLDAGWAILISDKGKRRRRDKVFLTPRLIESLRELPVLNEYVFGGIKSVKNAWKSIQEISGVNVHLYSLRHYFSSRLIRLGYNQTEVMLAMRHTRPATSLIYIHVDDETKRDITAALNRADSQAGISQITDSVS